MTVALLAKLSLYVGPVPITGQTLGVLLVAAALGAVRGALALTAYAAVGLIGLPIFAGPVAGPGYLLAPSFGFILGFIPCAWLMGYLADRGWDRTIPRGLAAASMASTIPFVIGVPYMALILTLAGEAPTFGQVMEWGVLPFIPGGILKAAIVACALPFAWRVRNRIQRRRDAPEAQL